MTEHSQVINYDYDNQRFKRRFDAFHEKEMATHSSILAWRILWTEEPGGPQSRGLQRVRHDRATEYAL